MSDGENKALVRRLLDELRDGWSAFGRRVAVSFIAIVRIVDGQLVEEWGGLDQPDLIRQMRGSPSAP